MFRPLNVGCDQREGKATKILRPVFFEVLWKDCSFPQSFRLASAIATHTPAWPGIFSHPICRNMLPGQANPVFLCFPAPFFACGKDNLSEGSGTMLPLSLIR